MFSHLVSLVHVPRVFLSLTSSEMLTVLQGSNIAWRINHFCCILGRFSKLRTFKYCVLTYLSFTLCRRSHGGTCVCIGQYHFASLWQMQQCFLVHDWKSDVCIHTTNMGVLHYSRSVCSEQLFVRSATVRIVLRIGNGRHSRHTYSRTATERT